MHSMHRRRPPTQWEWDPPSPAGARTGIALDTAVAHTHTLPAQGSTHGATLRGWLQLLQQGAVARAPSHASASAPSEGRSTAGLRRVQGAMAVTAQRFVRRNRKGRVLTVAREHYLRGAD